MFVTNEEAKAKSVVQECEERFPQFEEGKLYILRSEVKAFNSKDEEGTVTLGGCTGILVCFEGFNSSGKAHFTEPVLELLYDGTLQVLEMACYQSYYIPAEELTDAVFESFSLKESEFASEDDAMYQAYLKARSRASSRSLALSFVIGLMILLSVCGLVSVLFVDYPSVVFGIVLIASVLLGVIGMTILYCESDSPYSFSDEIERKAREDIYEPYVYKRAATLRKYAEGIGIDPHVRAFDGCMSVLLSNIKEGK